MDEWVLDNDSWDFERMRNFIPEDIIKKITAILPPQSSKKEDSVSWAGLDDGLFSVRSAHNILNSNSHDPNTTDTCWRVL